MTQNRQDGIVLDGDAVLDHRLCPMATGVQRRRQTDFAPSTNS